MKYALITLLIVSLVVGGFGCHATLSQEEGPLPGKGDWTAGKVPDLTDGWALLSFFLPDCSGCAQELPQLKRVRKTYEQQGLNVVGVTPVSRTEAQVYVKKHDLRYPVLADAGVEFELYGVREVPESFLVDPQGVVVARGMGHIQEALLTHFGE